MKDFLTYMFGGIVLALMAIYIIDGEVARQERLNGEPLTACLFESNCR